MKDSAPRSKADNDTRREGRGEGPWLLVEVGMESEWL